MKFIYLRTNLINGKQYVGQTSDLKRRERDWRKLNTSYSNKELDEDRIKYGLKNFKLEIIEICEDGESDKKENYYIEKYNTLSPNGYNKYSGGVKGFTFTMKEETKKKISESEKGIRRTDETKEKISKGLQNHPEKSKTVYQYTLDKNLVKIYPSTREAARQTGYNQANIWSCCTGGFFSKKRNKWINRIQYNGYIWSYKPI